MSTKKEKMESAYYKRDTVLYNKYLHSYVHMKKVEERRNQNIEKYGVEREPLSKEELEALIKRQDEERERLKKKIEVVKPFNEKEWLGNDVDDSNEETDLEDSDDSDIEISEKRKKSREENDESDEEYEDEENSRKVRIMDKFDFSDDVDTSASTAVFVSGFHKKAKEDKFKNTFEDAGIIKSICFPLNESKQNLGWAIVEYYDSESAEKAISEYNEAINRGKKLNVIKFNRLNEFFIVQDEDDLEIDEAEEVLNAINKKVWESTTKILKQKIQTYLEWKKNQETLSKREEIILQLIKEEHDIATKESEKKRETKASKKRKERPTETRTFKDPKKSKRRKKN